MNDPTFKPLVVVPREEWNGPHVPSELEALQLGDMNLLFFGKLGHPITDIILSYTETDTCYTPADCKNAMQELWKKYEKDGLHDIPYNFVVGGDGTVYEGRGWRRKSERNMYFPHLNDTSIEIAHFGKKGGPPPMEQITGSWELVLYGVGNKYILSMPERHILFY